MVWLAAAVLAATLATPALDVETPRGALSLKDHPRGGQPGVCADELASALKGSLGRDEVSKYPVLTVAGHRVLVSTSSALASVDGKIVRLQQTPAQTDGCLWLPAEFLTAVLPLVLGGKVAVHGEAPKAPAPEPPPENKAPPAASAKSEVVSVDAVVAADSVRVTLTGKPAPSADLAQSPKDVTVTLSEGAFGEGPPPVGKGIVDAVECAKGGKKLRAVLGPGFKRIESFKLRNPDRLVLLFRGEGQRVAPPPPPEPTPAPEPAPSQAAPAAVGLPATPAEAPKKTAAFDVVVIDPGHGGPDTGANTADGLQEKVLTLAIAQKTEALLEREGLKVVLTRSTDVQVPLIQRTAIANYNRADLFLSIHLNASPAPSARGTETYYLSRDATDLWATQLAAKENAAGQENTAAPDGGLNLVLWELAQTSVIVESAALAEAIQQEFNALLGTADRGVRQAPFVVLEGAQMPAVLVEVAFLSNGEEAKRLNDAAFQDQVAAALVKSVLSFKARYERPQTPTPAP